MLIALALALTLPVAAPASFLDDQAGVLNDAARQRLESDMARHEEKTGVALAVVTLPAPPQASTADEAAASRAAAWPAHRRGILVLVAVREKKLAIEVGFGLHDLVPAELRHKIIRQAAPYLGAADWDNAISLIVGDLREETRSVSYALEPKATWPPEEPEPPVSWPVIAAVALILAGGVALGLSLRRRRASASQAQKRKFGGGSATGAW